MDRASAPRLDLFKLIVSFILGAILILMLLRGCATNPAVNALPHTMTEMPGIVDPTETPTDLPELTETAFPPPATETLNPSPTLPLNTPTLTEVVNTATSTPLSSETTSTVVPDSTSTVEATPIATTSSTDATPASGGESSCNTSVPSRLSVGQQARVILRLNMRSEASISAAIVQTNPANTQVEIIGGPVCTPVGNGAYLWWQIRLPDGAEGWSAESQLNQPGYFLEPIP
ncbi:MAG TPA: SH3 domain-containing protein [Anaerolineales bacterium]|nr:SH3 domain-containing protein [Anaerolineales bacterium]